MIIWVFGLVFVGGFDTAHAAARYIKMNLWECYGNWVFNGLQGV